MNLKEVRTQLIKLSGIPDLEDEDGLDNGGNFYINEGSRYLDQKSSDLLGNSRTSVFKTLAIGSYYTIFENCRSVLEVWIHTDTGVTRLVKADYSELKAYYGEKISDLDKGTPAYYALVHLRFEPNYDDQTVSEKLASAFADVVVSDSVDYNAVLITPPPDEAVQLEIVGNFYSPKLTANSSVNFWSARYPGLLLKAALMEIEVYNRNTQGVKDWEAAINADFLGIDMDSVLEQNAEVDALEG